MAGDAGPVAGGGGLRVSKLGKLQDKGKLGKLGKFHVQVCSGNVHTSDCGFAHCNGCVVNGISEDSMLSFLFLFCDYDAETKSYVSLSQTAERNRHFANRSRYTYRIFYHKIAPRNRAR